VRRRVRAPGVAAALSAAAALLVSSVGAAAETGPPRATIDRVAVRYYAPETGGSGHPRFVSERMLAFEARLDALAEEGADKDAYEDRFVRGALDRHVAEDMLSALAVQSGATPKDLASLADEEKTCLLERVGGAEALHHAMADEGIDDSELDALLRRRARAAIYVDRALTALLRPTDEQLREVFRTSAHPFKNQPFEAVRAALARWFVEERLRAAETTFLQVARARVRIVVVPRATETARPEQSSGVVNARTR
jgi:hypothetical protein